MISGQQKNNIAPLKRYPTKLEIFIPFTIFKFENNIFENFKEKVTFLNPFFNNVKKICLERNTFDFGP